MKYIGLQSQISSNNRKSILLLISFPLLLLGLVWLFFFAVHLFMENDTISFNIDVVNSGFLYSVPYVSIGVLVWFLIAWFSHSSMIRRATGSIPLERKENKRVYNLVENLCISKGIKMPKIHLIEDDSLNAFASGLSDKTFAVTFSRGIIKITNGAGQNARVLDLAYDTDTPNTGLSGYQGAAMEFTTGVLTGTTGADARITVSAANDGKIYIENRSGNQIMYWTLFR